MLFVLPSCVGAAEEADLAMEDLSYPHVLQAETATGAGLSVPDGAASGGAFHRNSVPGTTAYAPYDPLDTVSGTIVVRARQTGTGTAQLNLRIDGVDHGPVLVSSSTWADYTVPSVASTSDGPHAIGFYLRQCIGGACVLEVDTVTFTLFDPTPTYTALQEAENATTGGTAVFEAGTSGNYYRSFTTTSATASLGFTTTGPIVSMVVRRRAGGAASCTPRGRVTLDGSTVFDTHVYDEGWNEHAFAVSRPLGPHTLVFSAPTASVSCPMHFDVVTIGTVDPPPPPVLQYVQAESATGGGVNISDGTASGGAARRFTASYVGATVPSAMVPPASSAAVRVRVSPGCTGAVGAIRVDTVEAWLGSVSATTWTDIPISMANLSAGTHAVEFYPRYVPPGCQLDFDAVVLTP